ncbi:hypothetical protein BDV40DRAFT_264985 [Aspergillus tamarii]|uniref:Uncharacterized protein n=1 Tax=Aspergillus tamarii TaxID=41984 RepID=A0A5N6UVI4_ASPTM|nr:hypothetical protein BDV40DRAFT_264985 [Aspergillus tamarii]
MIILMYLQDAWDLTMVLSYNRVSSHLKLRFLATLLLRLGPLPIPIFFQVLSMP